MTVLDKLYEASRQNRIESNDDKIWCEKDHHHFYEYFTDFNEWLDGGDEEANSTRIEYNINGLAQPSRAFYASDPKAYHQAFKIFREARVDEVLSESYIKDQFADTHWYDKNVSRFEQLIKCFITGSVVPFIGAGLSVEGGFPTWKAHLKQQGRSSGLDAAQVEVMLNQGQYEQVIEAIEQKGYKDVFFQEVRDVFSKTGKLTDTTLRLTELFTDTLITTNYDQLLEQAFSVGEDNLQQIGSANILEQSAADKTTIIKLHGDIDVPAQCILGKSQYDEAYGVDELNLQNPIPKLISYHYKNSSLLFLGCSLQHDRTMQVFQAVKESMGDVDRPQHFALESIPEVEEELTKRNAYLLGFGITPIWFPAHCYEYIEQILRLCRNELRYQGYQPVLRKEALA